MLSQDLDHLEEAFDWVLGVVETIERNYKNEEKNTLLFENKEEEEEKVFLKCTKAAQIITEKLEALKSGKKTISASSTTLPPLLCPGPYWRTKNESKKRGRPTKTTCSKDLIGYKKQKYTGPKGEKLCATCGSIFMQDKKKNHEHLLNILEKEKKPDIKEEENIQ